MAQPTPLGPARPPRPHVAAGPCRLPGPSQGGASQPQASARLSPWRVAVGDLGAVVLLRALWSLGRECGGSAGCAASQTSGPSPLPVPTVAPQGWGWRLR